MSEFMGRIAAGPATAIGAVLSVALSVIFSACIMIDNGGGMHECMGHMGSSTCDTPEAECGVDCREQSDVAYEGCLAGGGSADYCMVYAGDLLQSCEAACGGSTDTSTCGASCQDTRYDTYMSCLQEGRSEDECTSSADTAYNECMEKSCGTAPPTDGSTDDAEPGEPAEPTEPDANDPSTGEPPTDTGNGSDSSCESQCELEAQMAFEDCLKQGGDERECQERAQMMFESCLSGCSGGTEPLPPEGNSCQTQCEAYANGVYSECMVWTNDPYTCQQHAQLAAQSCMYGCSLNGGSTTEPPPDEPPPDEPPPPTDDDCLTRCEAYAMDTYNQCLATDNSPERCKQLYTDTYNQCASSCTGQPPPDEPPTDGECQSKCDSYAMDTYNQCMAAGNSPERCKQLYIDTYNSCVSGCSTDPQPTPTPDSSCQPRCEEYAMDTYNQCIASGGSQERCKQQYTTAYDDCMSRCTP